jgi:hypothetical protein
LLVERLVVSDLRYQSGNLRTEHGAYLAVLNALILDHVVQQRGDD